MRLLDKLADIRKDKLLHSFYGTFIYVLFSYILGPVYALAVTYLGALAKEVYDSTDGEHTSDWKDFVATVFLATLIAIGA